MSEISKFLYSPFLYIVSRLNAKFGTSYSLNQVKQKEQDLKKDYRVVKELKEQ
jgi:hypothetical protein